MRTRRIGREAFLSILLAAVCFLPGLSLRAQSSVKVEAHWDRVIRISRTSASPLVVSNPLLRLGSSIHGQAFKELHDLNSDYVDYLAWCPYPKLGVAELEPPHDGKTFWDFSAMDPLVEDFLEATEGHPVILDFSTIPQWMFITSEPVPYPRDPNQVAWSYSQGTELRDPSMMELTDYYVRLASWYSKGGFADEYGKWHESGHHYKIDYWGVGNEVDAEHSTTPEQYVARYDAIVGAMRRVIPNSKFVGPYLADPSPIHAKIPRFFEYFLDPKNHKPGIPIDMLAYHFYAMPASDESFDVLKYCVFDHVDRLLDVARYIDLMRQRFRPHAKTILNEMGIIMPQDFDQGSPGYVYKSYPEVYRNLYGAVWAYAYGELTRLGLDVVGESQLVGQPGQFPSVALLDWNTGKPFASFLVLKLVNMNFGPGDKVVETSVSMPPAPDFVPAFVAATGFVTRDGKKKLLLVNKRDRTFEVSIPGGADAEVQVVDQTTDSSGPRTSTLTTDQLSLGGFGVAVVTLRN